MTTVFQSTPNFILIDTLKFEEASPPYIIYLLDWYGIAIKVKHTPTWFQNIDLAYVIDHLEITADCPIPMTNTGYKSLFLQPQSIKLAGGILAYMETWANDIQSKTKPSAKHTAPAPNQLSMFDR